MRIFKSISQAALYFVFSKDLVQPKSGIVRKLGTDNTKGEEKTEHKHIWKFANHHDIYSKNHLLDRALVRAVHLLDLLHKIRMYSSNWVD